jgi:hypothetical protein
MKATVHNNDVLFLRVRTRDLDSVLAGLSTRVGVENTIEGGWEHLQEALSELQHGLLVIDSNLTVDHLSALLLSGLDDARVAVTYMPEEKNQILQ